MNNRFKSNNSEYLFLKVNLTLLTLLALISVKANADNSALFNQAMSAGRQYQFLGQNSTIDSYAKANGFESNVAINANAGNASAKNSYNNAAADSNYLYNAGTQNIQACENQTDPRCSVINKYTDKDTQTQLQAYTQGVSAKYTINVTPDPVNGNCSKVTRKAPFNPVNATCTPGLSNQSSCTTSIAITLQTHQCNPNDGSCATYQNSDCQLTQPYVASTCISYQYDALIGCSVWYKATCSVGSTYRTPGWCDSGARDYPCTPADRSGYGTNWQCNSWSQARMAVYICKTYNYNNQCAGYKS